MMRYFLSTDLGKRRQKTQSEVAHIGVTVETDEIVFVVVEA